MAVCAECWWDQWLLDVLLANGLGIYIGLKLATYLETKVAAATRPVFN